MLSKLDKKIIQQKFKSLAKNSKFLEYMKAEFFVSNPSILDILEDGLASIDQELDKSLKHHIKKKLNIELVEYEDGMRYVLQIGKKFFRLELWDWMDNEDRYGIKWKECEQVYPVKKFEYLDKKELNKKE